MSQDTPTQDTKRKINWTPLLFIGIYHVALLVALPLYLMNNTPSWGLIAGTFVLVVCGGLGITAGYHRLYSHKTYSTHPVVEFILLIMGTLAVQSSVLRWSFDHRIHHQHVDTERDPYGTPKGFWHSHLLWLFIKGEDIDERYIKDLMQNRMLVFQHRHYNVLMALVNILSVLVLFWITGDLIGSFVIGFLLRLFINHHTTWFINSLAHMWGAKPYSTEHSAVNNFILAFLTYGEGYHNFHHTFAGDYRNGVRWYQFDPTKYLIWVLSKLGLASNLKRVDHLMIKKKLVQADRKLLVDHLKEMREKEAQKLVEYVESMSEKLSTKINSAKAAMDRYRSIDRKVNRDQAKELREKFRTLSEELKQDLKTWRRLCHLVLEMRPALPQNA